MIEILCQLALLYEVCIIGRVILSWFPTNPGSLLARVNGVLMRITDPLLVPLRRILPNTGVLDLSPIIAILAIDIVLRRIILRC